MNTMNNKILWLEDNKIEIEALHDQLVEAGYIIKIVKSTEDAIEQLVQNDWDFVFFDSRLGGNSTAGADLYLRLMGGEDQLSEKIKKIPFMFITGYSKDVFKILQTGNVKNMPEIKVKPIVSRKEIAAFIIIIKRLYDYLQG
ncbi:response regulator [Candidatus Magnetaquiglobus chichijimensis]|uniref:response regulator n=1 Tax=Candidatus Magnetaquiglobus chichijimensis TaxID=3141448 RepID=UPI003B973C94